MIIQLSIPLKLSEICKYGNAILRTDYNPVVERIITDSREAKKDDIFICLNGEKENGTSYIDDARSRGALTISEFGAGADAECKNVEDFLLFLSGAYISLLKKLKYRIAITGSVGKTTTKEFIYVLCSNKLSAHKNYGNYNNYLGFSATVLSAPADTEIIIAEMGMNSSGEISRLSRAFKPTHSIITNIGHAHIGKLGTISDIAKAKLEILDGAVTNFLIVPYGEPLLSSKGSLFYSITDKKAERYLCYINGKINYYENGKLTLSAKSELFAEHHLSALLIAIAIASELGIYHTEISNNIPNIRVDILRQKTHLIYGINIIDDTYSSSPEAVIAEIKSLKRSGRMFSLLLGDMLELGDNAIFEHRKIGTIAYKSGARHIYTFGHLASHIAAGAEEAGMSRSDIFINEDISDPKKSAYDILNSSQKGEYVLIKASHALHAERIIEHLKDLSNA